MAVVISNWINYQPTFLHLHAVWPADWPFGMLMWYSPDKKWRYKQNEEGPVYGTPFHTVPIPTLGGRSITMTSSPRWMHFVPFCPAHCYYYCFYGRPME